MPFKPLKIEDFDLTPKEMKILVQGAQKFFPDPEQNEEAAVDETAAPQPEDLNGRKS